MRFLNKVHLNWKRGSIYIELLLAFFVWLIILQTVIPSFLHLTIHRKSIFIDHMGYQVLTRQFEKLIYDQPIETKVELDGFPTYVIDINEQTKGIREICVHYESREGHEKSLCRWIHKE